MAFDVVACKLRGEFRAARESGTLARVVQNAVGIHDAAGAAGSAGACGRFFSSKNLRAESVPRKDRRVLQVGWHRIQRWGDFILHVSIVVGLAGALMGAMYGFEENASHRRKWDHVADEEPCRWTSRSTLLISSITKGPVLPACMPAM